MLVDSGVRKIMHASHVSAEHEKLSIFFVGGWNQNDRLMSGFLGELASYGITSWGVSGFDSIDPTTYLAHDSLGVTDRELLDLPARNLARASLLNTLYGNLVQSKGSAAVIDHCAGANIHLTALKIQSTQDVRYRLPNKGILAEPMIVDGVTTRDYRTAWAKHERAARSDDSLITMESLRAEGETVDAKSGVPAITDITESRGTRLLADALANGADFSVVVGENDYAANADLLTAGFQAAGIEIPVEHYPDQQRTGHGYLLDQPAAAARLIAPLLLDRFA